MNSVSFRIRRALEGPQRRTLIGIGPMSRNCVEAVLELQSECDVPLFLIASRRQIDSEAFGGGYVNRWTTGAFARFVRERSQGKTVLLARDHGGPWQNPRENELDLAAAMQSAKSSYEADIEAGLDFLHIDPSVSPLGHAPREQALERAVELYEHAWRFARQRGKDVAFEVGTDEQGADPDSPDELARFLGNLVTRLNGLNLPLPVFNVVQTGTKVMETRNVGRFAEQVHIQRLSQVCLQSGIFLKEHNADYLPDATLELHPGLGIHAANVAPEFGVTETLELLRLLEGFKRNDLAERFLALAHSSRKWEKWMIPGSNATDRDRAIIAGHYVFSGDEFAEILASGSLEARKRGRNLESELKSAVKRAIARYLEAFGLFRRQESTDYDESAA